MAYRTLEVTLLSAKDLKRVNLISRMEVYAVVTISGDPLTRQCTQPDPYGGRHPSWNTTFRFNIPPSAATATGCLHVLLRTERALGDRDVGEVIVPLADILAGGGAASDPGSRPPQLASYQVRKLHRYEPRGVLNVSYRLGPIVAPQARSAAADDTATFVGYPVLPRQFYPTPSYAYMPSQLSLAPPPPPAQAAGRDGQLHPPAQYSLPAATYPQQQQPGATYPQQAGAAGRAALPPPANGESNGKLDFGVGLGAGLVSGAIGGMLVAGDVMMSDAAAYNSGYRAGLADGGAAAAYKNYSYRVPDKVEAKRTAAV